MLKEGWPNLFIYNPTEDLTAQPGWHSVTQVWQYDKITLLIKVIYKIQNLYKFVQYSDVLLF